VGKEFIMDNVLKTALGICLGIGAFKITEYGIREALAYGKKSDWYVEDQGRDAAKKAKSAKEAAAEAAKKAERAAAASAAAAAEAANPTPAS
jgi:membrane protein involved in colicin uptake